MKPERAFFVLFGCGLLTIALLVGAVTLMGSPEQDGGCGIQDGGSPVAVNVAAGNLDELQRANAATVIDEGRRRRMPDQAIVIALATASQESHFRNYANDGRGDDLAVGQQGIEASLRFPHEAVGTDHGSLGIFQQQWPWWGTMQDLMNPAAAAGKFYAALVRVPGWAAMPVTVAAQRVQSSANPGAYADDETLARALLRSAELAGSVQPAAYDADGSSCLNTEPGTVVFPLPPAAHYTDLRNWGHQASVWAHGHTGTDLSVRCGTPVLAATDGTVVIRTDQAWAGRWLVQVSTGPGQLATWYAHMRRVVVQDGQSVHAGDQLGEVGNLGNATGCHLHFEVHPHGGSIYEDNVNPTTWLAQHVGKPPPGPQSGVVPVSADAGGGAFTVSSFNVLGASHTGGHGKRPQMASGAARTAGMVALIVKHDIDVAGLQEFQKPQWDAFKARAGGSFGMYAPPHTRTDNTIIWRRSVFDLVRTGSTPIPYFNGQRLQMPYVLLRHKATGQDYWIADFHNPAETAQYHHQGRWRAEATQLEIALAARLNADGTPVIVAGDMNEHQSYFCTMTASGRMHAAAGGGTGQPCRPPTYDGIDWIYGSVAVNFGGQWTDDSALVDMTTDHPVVVAAVE